VATDHEISHGRSITWTLRATQAPKHIAEPWVGTSWIVELLAIETVTASLPKPGTCSSPACAPC